MYEVCDVITDAANGTVTTLFNKGLFTASSDTGPSFNDTHVPSCGVTTYLRSGRGGAPVPWIIAIIYLLISIYNVVVRILKFEAAQRVSMVLSFITAFTVTLAYVSTDLKPDMVMVWTPILLVGNAGSMLQVLASLLETYGSRLPGFKHFIQAGRNERNPPDLETIRMETLHILETGQRRRRQGSIPKRVYFDLCISILLLVWIITLQIVGMTYAFIGLGTQINSVDWCSPVFFSKYAVVSECKGYKVTDDGPKGIGCISLPPTLQRIWLNVTIVFVVFSLISVTIDLVIIVMFDKIQRRPSSWLASAGLAQGSISKAKRPLFTMFLGLAAILLVLTLAVYQAIYQPKGISSHVMVFGDSTGNSVCDARLTPSSLRGQIISWNDALFNKWRCAYYGCV